MRLISLIALPATYININFPLSYLSKLLPVYMKNERYITSGLILYMYKTNELLVTVSFKMYGN